MNTNQTNQFKNKKDAQQHGEKVVKDLPSGWIYRLVEDVYSERRSYFVNFENKELNLSVEEDRGVFSLYHTKKDLSVWSKTIQEGVKMIKEQLEKEAKELLSYAEKM